MNMSYMLLYGSVTGQAESIASTIAEESEKRKFSVQKKCFSEAEDIDLTELHCLVVVSSTTGDGEQPANALPFWKKLKSKEIQDAKLHNLNYTILGLGDSNYNQFCNGPKMIHEMLLSLGAKTFYEPKWADDGVGLEIVVEPWIDKLWTHLAKYFEHTKMLNAIDKSQVSNVISKDIPPPVDKLSMQFIGIKEEFDEKLSTSNVEKLAEKLGGLTISSAGQKNMLKELSFPPETALVLPSCPSKRLKLSFVEAGGITKDQSVEKSPHFERKDLIEVLVKNGKKLTETGAVKDAYQVTFDFTVVGRNCQAPNLEPGDAVDIICGNPKAEVDVLLERLGLLNELADKICVSASILPDGKKNAKIPEHIPKNGELFSIRHMLTNCVEIRSVPKKPLIRILAEFTSDSSDRRRLEELCSRQGGNNYLSVIRGNNLCLLDILLTFPSCQPPIERIFEHLPALQARPYSIASWTDLNQTFDIVFSLVDIPQGDVRRYPRRGISTGWLYDFCESNIEKTKIQLYKRNKKSFCPPSTLLQSYIMIGAGTGVAPFRGFLQQRKYLVDKHQQNKVENSKSIGKTWLIFGCRDSNLDFIYKNEMYGFKDNVLTRFDCAFSRENEDIKYVQHVIKANAKELVQTIMVHKAIVYVCGDALNMAKDVQEAIVQCLIAESDLNESEARKKITDMRLKDEYLQDLWS